MASDAIGFIGLGSMGSAMAERFMRAGYGVVVCDRDPQKVAAFKKAGAVAAETPRAVADEAEIVISCLPSIEASIAVAHGHDGVAHGRRVRVYVDTSTIGRHTAEQIAKRMPSGIGFLDAPVSGGPPAARVGTLSTIVSGRREAFDAAAEALSTLAANVFYMGEQAGMAQLAKLINNHLSNAGRVAAFEGFVLGMKGGLDPDLLLEVINASTGRNYTTTHKMAQGVLSGAFKFSGTLHVSLKDQALLLEQAHELGVPLRIAPTVLKTLQDAADNGYLERDGMYLIQYLGERAGIDVQALLSARKRSTEDQA